MHYILRAYRIHGVSRAIHYAVMYKQSNNNVIYRCIIVAVMNNTFARTRGRTERNIS